MQKFTNRARCTKSISFALAKGRKEGRRGFSMPPRYDGKIIDSSILRINWTWAAS